MGWVKDNFFGGAEKRAGRKQAQAAERAGQMQLEAGREAAGMLEPQRQIGYQAMQQMARELGLPGYGGPTGESMTGASPGYADVLQGLSGARIGLPMGGSVALPQFAGRLEQPASGMPEIPMGSGFQASPGYNFLKDEMTRAVNARAAASGSFYSGRSMKELARYSAGLASQEYGNYFNRLSGLSGMGTAATTSAGNFMVGGTSDYGSALMNAAAARASGITGAAGQTRESVIGLGKLLLA